MASILKTLDGGHLDRALFSSPEKKPEAEKDAKPAPRSVLDRLRFRSRVAGTSGERQGKGRKPRTDKGV